MVIDILNVPQPPDLTHPRVYWYPQLTRTITIRLTR